MKLLKVADASWGGAIDLGTANVTFSDDAGALTLSGDGNINVAPSTSTVYEFSLSFADSDVGELKVVEAPVYIRGGIYGSGDWGTDETMRLNFEPSDAANATEGGSTFSSVVTTTGTGFFKIADADWGNDFGVNYGASAEQETAGTNVIVLGVPFSTTQGNDSKNISFQEPAGDYRFSFNNETKELTVTAIE